MIALLLAATFALNGSALSEPGAGADFYAVVPHGVMVAVFGGVGLLSCWHWRSARRVACVS